MSNLNQHSFPGFIYFGTSIFATIILDSLKKHGIRPSLIVTTPDQPQGRKLVLTPPPVKIWAQQHSIPFIQPLSLKEESVIAELKSQAIDGQWELFIVASYGKLIPKTILDIPTHGILNIHPSLLPKFRGPSPIQSAILADEKNTGVTIMLLDEQMDHGPILSQKEISPSNWPPTTLELKTELGIIGGDMLIDLIPKWISGTIIPKEQNHDIATFTRKMEKEDGLLDLTEDPYKNFLKIQAFADWPKTYFFIQKDNKPFRVVIAKAHYENNALIIERVIPEGKNEMSYEDFKRGYLQ